MEHPENDAQYAGLAVNKGIEQPPPVSPSLKKMRTALRRTFTAAEYVEGIVKGDTSILSQAVTLVESSRYEHQAIAQEVIDFQDMDIIEDGKRVPRKADLRAFVLSGEKTKVWASGLTRFSRNADSFVVNSSQGGGFKDTWVLSR